MGIGTKLSAVALGAALLGLPLTATAAQDDVQARLAALEARIAAQDAELATLRGQAGTTWLNERRAEEVKSLVREVLADADTRASLQGEGVNAGYRNGFFIASEDGKFNLRINGGFQFRYAANYRDHRTNGKRFESGFQVRQTRLDFRGTILNKDLGYRIRLSANQGTSVSVDHAYITYALGDDWSLTAGQFKPQFLREENVGFSNHQAVERSPTADHFTLKFVQGAELAYRGDQFRATLAFHDGARSQGTAYNADSSDFALTSRVEYLAAGKWSQFNDFQSWSGESFGLLFGAAVSYEHGKSGHGATSVAHNLRYTADVSAEFGGINLFAAGYGQTWDYNAGAGWSGQKQWGVVLQAGAFIVPDKFDVFGRYEWIDFDNAADTTSLATVGVNYYLNKHQAKFTVQGTYVLEPLPLNPAHHGLAGPYNRSGQVALLSQFQLLF